MSTYLFYLDPKGVTSPLYNKVMELRKTDCPELIEEQLGDAILDLEYVEFNTCMIKKLKLHERRTPELDLPQFLDIRHACSETLMRIRNLVNQLQIIDRKHTNFDRPLAFFKFCRSINISERRASYLYDEESEGVWKFLYDLKEFALSRSTKKQLYIEQQDD